MGKEWETFGIGIVVGVVFLTVLLVNFGTLSNWKKLQKDCELEIPRNQVCEPIFTPKSFTTLTTKPE